MVKHAALFLSISIGLLTACGGKQKTDTGGAGGSAAQQDVVVKKVTLSTGVEMEYGERGAAGGKPVLLIHGIYDSRHAYDLLIPQLPASWHIYAIDLRGHGGSSRPDTGYTQGDFAGDVVAFLDAMKETKVNVIGHSMGALVAHKVAIEHPERVDNLVLLGGAPTLAGKPGPVEAAGMFATFKDPVDPNFVNEFVRSSFVKTPSEDFMKLAVAEAAKIPAKVWSQVIAEGIKEDHVKALSQVKAHTLLIWGDKDPVFDRNDQKVLDEGIPDSTLIIYPGVGHGVPSEEPAKTAHDIVEFLH